MIDKPELPDHRIESPLNSISNESQSAKESESDSRDVFRMLSGVVIPFFISNALFYLVVLLLRSSVSIENAVSLVVFATVVTIVAGAEYGWLLGSCYISRCKRGKNANDAATIQKARSSRWTMVFFQCVYFPACVFGPCAAINMFARAYIV